MSEPSMTWLARCHDAGFRSCALLLTWVVVVFFVAMAPAAIWWQGLQALPAMAAAAVVCLLPGLAALAVTSRCRDQQRPLLAVGLGMGLRLTPPLLVCLVLAVAGSTSGYLSFVVYLLTFYLVTLALETYIAVQMVSKADHGSN